MAMTAARKQFVVRTSSEVKALMSLYTELCQLNALWAGAPNFDDLITQADLDEVAEFSGVGLTAQQLADAEYALASIKSTIEGALVPLAVLVAII
jgi:hypothetical protein